jgi:hypothetical protein
LGPILNFTKGIIATLLLYHLFVGVAFTEECKNLETQPELPSPSAEQQGNMVDETHAGMSKQILATANWLDSFFDDARIESECNKTRAKLTFTSFIEEGNLIGFDFKARLKLVLPQLEDRLHLVVSGNPDDEFRFDEELQEIREQAETQESRDITAALQYFFKATREKNISLQSGLRLSGIKPVTFIGPRYRQTIDFDPWALRLTQRIRWYTDIGWYSNTQVDIERPIFERFFFRTTGEGTWSEDKEGYFYNFRFLLFQPLSERRSLSYEWNNYFETQPNNRLKDIYLRVRYRQSIWRKWLFYEVAPQVAFLRDSDYNFSPGIILRLELIFGHF